MADEGRADGNRVGWSCVLKICIVTYDEYSNIPYVQKYEHLLTNNDITYDIILWNRSEIETGGTPNARCNYTFGSPTGASKLSKVVPLLKWRRHVNRILRSEKYDGLIICTTLPGILISGILTGDYCGKFILDVRDFTYENNPLYCNVARKNLEAAGLVVISSERFLQWMPPGTNAVITHNISNIDSATEDSPSFSKAGPMTIGFVGGVRYFGENKKFIGQFANSDMFKLLYIGKHHPGSDLMAYCEKNGIWNVEFRSQYDNAQKPDIYRDIDFINSVYGANCEETRTLLPHRLYDCVLFKKPIIVSKGTYLEDVVTRFNLGLTLNIDDDNAPEKICSYMKTFKAESFSEGCDRFLSKVLHDEDVFFKRVDEFFKSLEVR